LNRKGAKFAKFGVEILNHQVDALSTMQVEKIMQKRESQKSSIGEKRAQVQFDKTLIREGEFIVCTSCT